MKDIVWLDWARVLGIFLVVFGHVLQQIPLWQENITVDIWNWIYLISHAFILCDKRVFI